MAVVLDSTAATLRRTVFIKPPDMVRQLTAIPRAIVTFNLLNFPITAKPVNDTAELIIGINLDGNFAYRWIELVWSLTQDVAFNWNNRAYLELTNAIRNLEIGATQHHVVVNDDVTVVPGPSERIIARAQQFVSNLPRYIIQTPAVNPAATPVISFKASNENVAVGAAGTTNFLASFYEYDIEQVEMYPIHYAALTLER